MRCMPHGHGMGGMCCGGERKVCGPCGGFRIRDIYRITRFDRPGTGVGERDGSDLALFRGVMIGPSAVRPHDGRP